MNKKPRTKDQIISDAMRIKEATRQKALIKEKIYPTLIEASENIQDAKMFLSSFSSMIMDAFLVRMQDVKFKELKLNERLLVDGPHKEHFEKLLSHFDDESVFTAREITEGLRNEVQMFIDDEMKSRKLDTLKTNFLD